MAGAEEALVLVPRALVAVRTHLRGRYGGADFKISLNDVQSSWIVTSLRPIDCYTRTGGRHISGDGSDTGYGEGYIRPIRAIVPPPSVCTLHIIWDLHLALHSLL